MLVDQRTNSGELKTLVAAVQVQSDLIALSPFDFSSGQLDEAGITSRPEELPASGRRQALHLGFVAGDVRSGAVAATHLNAVIVRRYGKATLALADDNVGAGKHVVWQLRAPKIRYMHARLQPLGLNDREVAIRAARHDVCPAHGLLRAGDWLDLHVELPAHLAGVSFSMGLRRAVDPDFAYVPHTRERLQIGAGHAARPDHPYRMGIGPGQILRTQASTATNPHVLQVAIVDDGQRFAVAGTEQEDQATIRPWLDAV